MFSKLVQTLKNDNGLQTLPVCHKFSHNGVMEERIPNYSKFWPFYLSQHRHPVSRRLHYLGTTSAIGVVISSIWIGPSFLILALLVGYGPAWVGHFFFEKNRPATFQYPLWSLRGDFHMLAYFLSGKLDAELKRLK